MTRARMRAREETDETASKPHARQGPAAPGSRLLTLHTLGLGLVSILAFLAVVLLAGHRGETTPTTPAFLAKTLGPSVPTARPAGRPAPGVAVRFGKGGLAVSRRGSTLRLGVVGPAASPWAGFVNGVSRRTSFGLETVTYDPGKVEQFLTVTEHQGPKTWRWGLRGAEPQLRADGSVALGSAGLAIAPAAVLDTAGRGVTPAGTRWSLRRETGGWLLELSLDDAALSLPYVIDPAITWRATSFANNAGGALTLTINKPAGTVQNDLLLAHVSVRGGAAATINAPAGWSLVRRTNNATAPGLAQAVYSKVAGGSEGASYQWSFDSSRRAAGGITGYYGVDDANAVDVWSENTGSGKNAQANTVTTTGANHRLAGLYASSASTSFTPPAGMSELYDTSSTGSTAEAADTTQVAAGATGNKTSVAANNGSWVAQLVALRLDAVSPTAPAPTVSESGADSHVIGSTFYYRPGGGGGSFTVTDAATDGGSGLTKVTFPGMAGGAGITPTSSLDVAFPGPYSRAYTWTTGASDSGAKTVTAVDNAGNSASTTFTVRADSGAPTAQTISLPGGPYFNALSVPYTTSDGTDALSGLDTTTRLVERATATLAGDGCGTFGSFATAPASPDTTVVAGNCYRYRFTVRDKVGNVSAAVTADAKIDTGNPSVSFTAPVEVGNPGAQYYDSGSKTHYFRPGASGSFTLTASASDTETAVAQVAFPDLSAVSGWSGSTGGNDTTTPYASPVDYNWSSGATAPGARSVGATDRAGNTASAGFTVAADSTAPSGQTIALTGPGAPWYTSPSVTFSLGGGSDSGSGLDPSSQVVTRETGTLSGGSCSGFVADGGSYSSPDSSVAGDHCYRYTFVESDRVGNQATGVSVVAKVDTTAPGAVMADPGANVRGTVSLGSTTGDSGSGLASVSYQYRPAGGCWTVTPAAWDTLVIADGLYDLRVIALDNAGNQTASPAVTTRVDNTDPFTSDDAPGGYRSTPVTVTLTPADSGSGVADTEYSVDGVPFQSGTSVVIPAPGDHSNDGTHTIRYRSTDVAGNVEALRTASVRIDTTPPGGGSGDPGQYLRGTVTLTATPSDSGAGIDSVVFQRSPASLGSWTTIATDFSDPYAVDWDTTAVADGSYDLRFLFRDGATNESVSTLSGRVVDNAVPSGTLTAPADGAFVAGAVALAADASDATSGVALVAFQVKASGAPGFATVDTDSTAPYTTNWDSTVAPDGPAEMRVVMTDRAGNTAPSASATVTLDNQAPLVTLDDPGANVRGTVGLTATSSADTAQVAFQRRPAGGGGWTTIGTDLTAPFAASFDTTAVADGSYELRAVATDLSLNQGSSAVRATRVDNTDPTASLDTPLSGATVGGPAVVLAATAADGGSGVASVLFQYRTPTGSWTNIAADSTDPYTAAWDTTALSDGPYFLRAVVSDAAGNSAAPPQMPVTVDSTAPTVSLDDPGSPLSGVVPLSASASADTTRVVFERRSASGGAWAEIATDNSPPFFTASLDTTGLPDELYDLRVTASDSLGNSASDTRSSLRVDNTAPLLVASAPADGAIVGSADAISLTADETLASLSAVSLDGAPLPPPALSGTTAELDTGDLADGPHTLWATLHDLASQTTVVLLHFTVWNAGAGDFPYVEKNDPVAVGTTLVAVGGGARVTVPADATLLSGGDWLVLRIDPGPAAGAAAGFEGTGDTFDVSLRWALGGGSVHEFDRPLRITIPGASGAVLPATYESGAWRLLPRVPTAGSLPPGWSDGYYVDSSGVQILTLHLSRFALLRDVEAPTPPDRFAGSVSAGTLTLSWAPGTDNSGPVDHFSVFVDGSLHATYGSAARSASLGAFTSADARAFSISESDAAGNESGRTHRLRALPDVAGLTEAQARAALEARGFHAGSVQRAGSATVAAGRVIASPGSVHLAEEGTTVDFTVSAGSAPLPFDFTVLAPGRFSWARASSFTVRFSVSRPAAVVCRLVSPRGKTLRTWRIPVTAGSSSSRLKMPASARRGGRYSIRWTANAGSATLSRTTYLRVSGKTRRSGHAAAVPVPRTPAEPSARGPYPIGSPPNGAHLGFRDERAGLSGAAAPVLPSGGGAGEAIPAGSGASRGVVALLVALGLALLFGALALSVFHPQVPRRHRLEW